MKKIILGTLCALMVTGPAFAFNASGNDKGNAGDGVFINNELVMRDFVSRANFTEVEDNVDFLNSITGFKELIFEIAHIDGDFAERLLNNILNTSIYLSDTDLEVLSANQTGVGGVPAQVQLAIRWDREILISPKFFSDEFADQRAYLMIHESLHGILGGAGAIHHTRVRNVVNFLKTNRGHYNKQELLAVLNKNNVPNYKKYEQFDGFIFDLNLPKEMRCYVLSEESGLSYSQNLRKYLGLDCTKKGEDEHGRYTMVTEKIESYVKSQMGLSYLGDRETYSVLKSAGEVEVSSYVFELKLVKTGFFNSDMKSRQQDQCYDNRYDYKKTDETLKELEFYSRFLQDVNKYLARADVPAKEKLILQHHIETGDYHNRATLSSAAKTLEQAKTELAKARKVHKKNESNCVAMYGKRLGFK